jgi:hypothetical protein
MGIELLQMAVDPGDDPHHQKDEKRRNEDKNYHLGHYAASGVKAQLTTDLRS